ncbi:MAG: hypothetical protein ABSG25_15630, partial [Bryobacteraceae bacterium]
KYFLFTVWLAANAAMSLWLLRVYFASGFGAYSSAWYKFQAVDLVLIAGVILESYILQARHCRRFLWSGAVVAGVFGMMSLTVALCTTGILSDSFPVISLSTRYFNITCFLFVRFSAWFFGLFFVKMRENVRWHIRILSGLCFCQALAWWIYSLYNIAPAWAPVGHFLNLGSCIAAYILWSLKLTQRGEQWSESPEMPHEEFDAQTREHKTANQHRMTRALRLRQALLGAWRLS